MRLPSFNNPTPNLRRHPSIYASKNILARSPVRLNEKLDFFYVFHNFGRELGEKGTRFQQQ